MVTMIRIAPSISLFIMLFGYKLISAFIQSIPTINSKRISVSSALSSLVFTTTDYQSPLKSRVSRPQFALDSTVPTVADAGLTTKRLSNVIACVTGASRGIGRGIALGLAEHGATIYVTGRSVNSASISEKGLGGSLEELVSEINKLGGVGIPLQVDHNDDKQVQELFHRIEKDCGRLDILVNNAFQLPSADADGNPLPNGFLFRNFWEQPGWFWDPVIDVGLRSHYTSTCCAVPLLMKASGGPARPLIVHISSFGGKSYSFNVAYGVGKAGVDRMAKDMSKELRPFGINCISLYPGVVRTERMETILDSGEWQNRTGLATPKQFVESPTLTGSAIAALYSNQNADSYLQDNNGKVMVVAEIAKKYNVKDKATNSVPPSIRSVKFLLPSLILGKVPVKNEWKEALEAFLVENTPDILLPMSIMESEMPE